MMLQGDKYTHSFVVDTEVYEGFIRVFKDRNPLHTDSGFAHSKGFREVVMHGNILNGFVSYFIGECLPVKDVIIHTQSIKYLMPVYLHDQLELNAQLTEVFDSVDLFEFKFFFKNGEGKKVAKGEVQIGLLK